MSDLFAQYLEYGHDWLIVLLAGARITALLTIAAFLVGMILGAVVAALRSSSRPLLRGMARIYLELVRGVPVLAILFLVYFGLPGVGLTFDPFTAGVIGLGISSSAYVSEVIRAGVGTLHKGQREAALAIGMTPRTAARLIILPQVLRVSLPALLSTLIVLLKDSSLCALITVNEIMLTARALSTEYFLPLAIFIMAGAIYFGIAWPLSLLARRLERTLSRGRRTIA